jgi:hypothetical protein
MSYDIRDPIYGFIHPNETEQKIIDTKVFQRLKRIKQLALANLVYPGANHTRFEHSLGVMHLAGLIAEQLKIDPEKKEIVCLAALLHDIGHGPFSHVSEDVMKNLSENIEINGKINFHETITCKIIEQDKDLRKFIAEEKCKKISSLIKEGYEENYLKEIISGPLDADKMDYLLRDSYHCGVKYGIYDYHQLIKSIVAESAEPKDKHDLSLMIHEDGIRAFEQFLLAKYYIATQVYRHKIRLITDMMIVRAIKLGVEVDKVDFLKEIYIYSDSPEYIKEYLKWNDEKLMLKMIEDEYKDTFSGKIFRNLYNRKLLKQIFSESSSSKKFDKNIGYQLKKISKIAKKCIEKKIAEKIEQEKEFVIINIYQMEAFIKSKGFDLFVAREDGYPEKIEDQSELYSILEKREAEYYIDCYAPLKYKDNSDKRKKYEKHEEIVYNTINEYFKSIGDSQ